MTKRTYLMGLLLAGLTLTAQAVTPKEQYSTDSTDAAARYAEDRAICGDERNQGQRMKCLRVAKAENAKSLAEAKARLKASPACPDCGKVTAVNMSERKGEGNAVGMLAGGAAGALLGRQVGSGTGKDLATIAGAAGGAYAGKKIQEKATSTKVWTVDVQYDNGRNGSFTFERDPGVQRGDRVKSAGQSLMRI